jgi:hypothetical protein
MKRSLALAGMVASLFTVMALGQTASTGTANTPAAPGPTAPMTSLPAPEVPDATAPAAITPDAATTAAPASHPANGHETLVLRALDKITGKAVELFAPLNQPVKFKTLTIVARYCYSTPPSETPETSAFLQIDDHRPDRPERRVFSGWMYASSPGLNGMQHPLYDVWVINCKTSSPGQEPSVVAVAPVKPVSPNAGADEKMPTLPEDAGQ